MKIKILIPVYNDWQSVTKLISEIDDLAKNINHEISIIVVNDASTHDRDPINNELINLKKALEQLEAKSESQSKV